MTDVVTSSRAARERLAQGLGALQAPGVPDHLMTVAEPIAQAMSALHRIESTRGTAMAEAAPMALESVRRALALLQAQPVSHPAVDQAMESVAGSLGLIHSLKPPSAPPAAAVAPAQQPALGYQATMVAQPAAPMMQPGQAPVGMGARPGPVGGSPQPAASGIPASSLGSTMPSQAPPRGPATPAETGSMAGGATLASAPTAAGQAWPQASATPGDGTLLPRIEVALGAHSATNFYKGLSGNDVIDSGGVFVATYQIPPIGTAVLLKVALPGGYEFEAHGVVRWTRDVNSNAGSDTDTPGFGAQFTHISTEGRQLVYRYVRNREPLFHDDL